MLVCDTSGLIALFDASDAHHQPVRSVVDVEAGPLVVSPYVVAELDYLMATRRGVEIQLDVLNELSGGAWELPGVEDADLRRASQVVDRYRDQDIGLADASVVVLAARYRTDRLLTLDHRHFGVVRTMAGAPFHLLPGPSPGGN